MIDLDNLNDNDVKWMRSSQAAADAARNPNKSDPLSHPAGIAVFNRYLADLGPENYTDNIAKMVAIITYGTPDFETFREIIMGYAAEFQPWMREAADARYKQELDAGTPVPDEVREHLEFELAEQFSEVARPDFFESVVLPIAKNFTDKLVQFDPRAVQLALVTGMPLYLAQSLVDGGSLDDAAIDTVFSPVDES